MAVPPTINHNVAELTEAMLQFTTTTTYLCDLTRTTMEAFLNTLMSLQADELCGASYKSRSDERVNARNGYRHRPYISSSGTLNLAIPKLRQGSYFPSELFEKWSRIERGVASAISEVYVGGVSTRKVQKVAREFGIENISKDQVSRLCAVLDQEVKQFLEKDWSDTAFPYLYLDATYVHCREGKGIHPTVAFLTAIGVDLDGRKHFLSFRCADSESFYSWNSFLQDLKARGVDGCRLVISDAHDGLKRAIGEVYPFAAWQRCITHVKRDVLGKIDTQKDKRRAAAIMSPIFSPTPLEPTLTRALWQEAASKIEEFSPQAAKCMDEAELDALTHLSFPPEHQVRIRTNNLQERTNAEFKRRARVVQIFPTEGSVMRLLGAIAQDTEEQWASGNRYMNPESLKQLVEEESIEIQTEKFVITKQIKQSAIDMINTAITTYEAKLKSKKNSN